jgi:serine palmitoyltransferase
VFATANRYLIKATTANNNNNNNNSPQSTSSDKHITIPFTMSSAVAAAVASRSTPHSTELRHDRSLSSESFHSTCSMEKSTPPTAPGTPRAAFDLDSPASPVELGKPNFPLTEKASAAPAPQTKRHFTAAPTRLLAFITIVNYAVVLVWAYIRESCRWIVPDPELQPPEGYAKLTSGESDFFSRRFYRRIRDCWNRPINTRASRVIGVMERESKDYNKTFQYTGKTIPAINFASYNYLGFAEDLASVTEDNIAAIQRFGTGACIAPEEGGRTTALRDLEEETAEFLGKEAAVVYAMGFVTNFSGLAPLFCKETLVVSDSLNHASLVLGIRNSKGNVRVFKHNDMTGLESVVRKAIVEGQPRTHKAWKRIVIVVEGIYSMEGEILDLPRVVEIKKKYKCLLYVDEAHSIGALGPHGRGVCDHHNVDPADVDLLMGTYTKSFGSIGGYIAGDKRIISDLKKYSSASLLGDAMFSAAAQQALSSLRVMQGKDGTTVGRDKIAQLKENSVYMRNELIKRDLIVLGEDASPVIPIMIYQPNKLSEFSRQLLKRNVAVVVVGYPATT